ncbi:hypothetical protein HJFPF1_03472 [Paramyrothecium foliicola]|nr:hypothetical protein HJFPF1_03472 [Paramyrothecium foliicola]
MARLRHDQLHASLVQLTPITSQTRITTKYSVKPVKPRSTDDSATAETEAKLPPRASLVFKTYDPVSGVTLKFRTTKAAEVSRLVYASLGRLGRGMAAVPEPPELSEVPMPDAPAGASAEGGAAAAAQSQQAPQQGGGGGGGKKKKKGKK